LPNYCPYIIDQIKKQVLGKWHLFFDSKGQNLADSYKTSEIGIDYSFSKLYYIFGFEISSWYFHV